MLKIVENCSFFCLQLSDSYNNPDEPESDSGLILVNLYLYPILTQTMFNYLLFAFVPPNTTNFYCLSLNYNANVMSAPEMPWRLILDAWGFANDAVKAHTHNTCCRYT